MDMVNAFNQLYPDGYAVPPLAVDELPELAPPPRLPRSEWRARRTHPQPLPEDNDAAPPEPQPTPDSNSEDPSTASPAAGPPRTVHASKVWFLCGDQVLSFCRSDSAADKPQFDTFGGRVDDADHGSYVACIRRELAEEVNAPPAWLAALEPELRAHPTGHELVELRQPSRRLVHLVATWTVSVESATIPALRNDGAREALPGTLSWRHADIVISNLSDFRFARPLAAFLRRACRAPEPIDTGSWTCTSCKASNNGGLYCDGCGLARSSFGVDHVQPRRIRIPVTTATIKSNEQLRAVFGRPFNHPYGPFGHRVNPAHSDGDRKGTRAVVEFQLSRLIGSVRRHVWVYPGRAGSALTIDEQNRVRAYRLDHPDAQL